MMKKIFGVLLSFFAFIYLPAAAQNVAVVNGKPIPKSQVDAVVRQLAERGQPDTPELRARIKDDLIMREILVQEANKKKLGSTPEVKNQIDMMNKNILIRALMNDYVSKHPIPESQVKKEYDQWVASLGNTEYSARHILVGSEDDAKKIIAQLNSGTNFEELAKQQSKDPGSASSGGALGWATPNNFVKPFADAMITLKKGEITQTPVQTQFGYHVIKIDDTRPLVIPTYEEAKPRIERGMQEKQWQSYQDNLLKKAKVQ